MTSSVRVPFHLPPYPYDRVAALGKLAAALPGGMVDCSIGTPCDPPPPGVIEALSSSGSERGYPASAGSPALIGAAAAWLERRFGLESVPNSSISACVGTKELVASVPQMLRLREPERDTVLYPAVSYPTYAMGAALAGCRAVPVPPRPGQAAPARRRSRPCIDRPVGYRPRPGAVVEFPVQSDRRPGRPWRRGGMGPRPTGYPVFSDECYAEFTWEGPPRSVLETRLRRRGGRSLPLQALEPGRRAGGVLRRRP